MRLRSLSIISNSKPHAKLLVDVMEDILLDEAKFKRFLTAVTLPTFIFVQHNGKGDTHAAESHPSVSVCRVSYELGQYYFYCDDHAKAITHVDRSKDILRYLNIQRRNADWVSSSFQTPFVPLIELLILDIISRSDVYLGKSRGSLSRRPLGEVAPRQRYCLPFARPLRKATPWYAGGPVVLRSASNDPYTASFAPDPRLPSLVPTINIGKLLAPREAALPSPDVKLTTSLLEQVSTAVKSQNVHFARARRAKSTYLIPFQKTDVFVAYSSSVLAGKRANPELADLLPQLTRRMRMQQRFAAVTQIQPPVFPKREKTLSFKNTHKQVSRTT
ncbi:hypothetical protein BC832DRAFT_541013 [Gaertneriomyces semiglobifer]|nr:hypothetical protein BC832DRAFT_541013 [Gaertneriomyces semiglobifer]